jgi:hypothetical protein
VINTTLVFPVPPTAINETAVDPRPRAVLLACAPAAAAASPRAVVARPSSNKSARIAVQHAGLAQPGQAALPRDGQRPTYMTRSSAAIALTGFAGGGALGPHPAREPEPV